MDHVKHMQAFLDEEILPAEARYAADPVGVVEALKAEAKRRDLWNLFRPAARDGAALSNVDFAPVAELTGWSLKLAPEAVNAMAPDVENMIMLDGYATPEQRTRWLDPLLDGTIRSAFTVAEPDVASSDVTGLATTVRRDGDDYVISGRKYFIANAPDERCRLFLVMGRTDAGEHSILLVDRDTPGLEVVRPLTVFGFSDHHGYAEVALNDVRVPADALLGAEGQALQILGSRQGSGRIHYCMRLIGAAERAIDLMVRRARDRVAFGKPLAEQGVVREQIARSRMEVDQARLLVLRAAALLDRDPGAGASPELAAIKVVCPRVACDVIDRAIQIHGGAGVSDDTPLAFSYAYARTIRMAFGPDAIDVDAIAGAELARATGSVPSGAPAVS